MTRKCYKLTFTAPLHVSSGGFALEDADTFLRSDTLYSALCTTAADYWENEATLQDFFFPGGGGPPRFRLSSAFPYFQEIFFLPKPFFYTPSEKLPHRDKKRLYKARFVDSELWLNMITGEHDVPFFAAPTDLCNKVAPKPGGLRSRIIDGCWSNRFSKIKTEKDGKVQEEDITRLYEVIERPRVTIDRVSDAATIFHFAEIHFLKDAGLYFMADFDDEADIAPFEIILTLLSEQGLGADRSVGRGLFEWAETQAPIPLSAEVPGGAFVSLSLFVPDDHELPAIDFESSWYDFILRRGWVSNRELRRRAFRLFAEGSAFQCKTPFVPKGKLLHALKKGESSIGHDVWRSGLCFAVPTILPKEN